jgi:hypothetical protein
MSVWLILLTWVAFVVTLLYMTRGSAHVEEFPDHNPALEK